MYSSLQRNSSNKTKYSSLQGNFSDKTMYSSLQGIPLIKQCIVVRKEIFLIKQCIVVWQENSSNKTIAEMWSLSLGARVGEMVRLTTAWRGEWQESPMMPCIFALLHLRVTLRLCDIRSKTCDAEEPSLKVLFPSMEVPSRT